ncbi:TlpA family protein disulfide reductase [Winogradskyella ursingii]|uniref:TlpA family protein disulfide reductase n=1 Tax=Winogradskyella ursingii TaxID=2686079 RepID=UPI0015CBE255|nr:TlpA disulfide reductase family protein [Winogradskyella ursingii]
MNIIILVIIILLIIPKTRVAFQIFLHRGWSYINQSSLIAEEERKTIDYTDWKLISEDGNTINFEDTSGEVVFINLWATWCPPCIAEMPSLQLLYDDYKDKVSFLFITSDNFERVQNFKTKNDYTFETHRIISGSQKEFRTSSIPRTFVINKNGEIVIDESGAIDWNSSKIRAQLDELLAK